MAFPDMGLAPAVAAWDSFIQQNGNDTQVLLNDGVTTFTVKTAMRKRPVENLTDGLQQENDRLSVMASRWETGAGAGRMPEKGDILTINGRRQAIASANTVAMQDTLIAFNIELRG